MIVHHHLGLGDHFICNGLVNHLAEEYDLVYLACKRVSYPTVACLYREQPRVSVFPVRDEQVDVDRFARGVDAPVLRIGFERCEVGRFDESFYSQLGIPFEYRYTKFKLPAFIEDEDELYAAAASSGPYIVVHREASYGVHVLRIDSTLRQIDLRGRRSGDVFGNFLAYRRLIQQAAEVHCINSSVVHLVNSLDVAGRLVYHDVRKRNFQLRSGWTTVHYRARAIRKLRAQFRRRPGFT